MNDHDEIIQDLIFEIIADTNIYNQPLINDFALELLVYEEIVNANSYEELLDILETGDVENEIIESWCTECDDYETMRSLIYFNNNEPNWVVICKNAINKLQEYDYKIDGRNGFLTKYREILLYEFFECNIKKIADKILFIKEKKKNGL